MLTMINTYVMQYFCLKGRVYRFHVGKVGVNVKGLPGYHLVLKMLVNSGISDEETLTLVLGELSVAVNIHMKNTIQLE